MSNAGVCGEVDSWRKDEDGLKLEVRWGTGIGGRHLSGLVRVMDNTDTAKVW